MYLRYKQDRVRDHIPLEQGLRRSYFTIAKIMTIRVRDHIPLEQGLRLQKFDNLTDAYMSETIFH